MQDRQPQTQAVKKNASTGKIQDQVCVPIHNSIEEEKRLTALQPLSFKTASNPIPSLRNKHPIHREWGVENTVASKQRSIQQRTSSPLKDDPPMLQRWLAEIAKDQPYGNVDAFYSVGGKRL